MTDFFPRVVQGAQKRGGTVTIGIKQIFTPTSLFVFYFLLSRFSPTAPTVVVLRIDSQSRSHHDSVIIRYEPGHGRLNLHVTVMN